MKPVSNEIDKEGFRKAHEEYLKWEKSKEGQKILKDIEEQKKLLQSQKPSDKII